MTNAGNVTLHDPITVSDDKATDESCPALPAGGLAPGAVDHLHGQLHDHPGRPGRRLADQRGQRHRRHHHLADRHRHRPGDADARRCRSTKSASPATYNTAGQTINYSYVLKNTGNVTLSGPFTVTDDKATVTCPPDVTSLAVGDTLTCTASHTVTQADVDAGSITNIAKGHAFFGATPVDSNEDTKTVTADQNAGADDRQDRHARHL